MIIITLSWPLPSSWWWSSQANKYRSFACSILLCTLAECRVHSPGNGIDCVFFCSTTDNGTARDPTLQGHTVYCKPVATIINVIIIIIIHWALMALAASIITVVFVHIYWYFHQKLSIQTDMKLIITAWKDFQRWHFKLPRLNALAEYLSHIFPHQYVRRISFPNTWNQYV